VRGLRRIRSLVVLPRSCWAHTGSLEHRVAMSKAWRTYDLMWRAVATSLPSVPSASDEP